MAKSITRTATHYDIQNQRRAKQAEEWRARQRTVIKATDFQLEPTERRMRRGVYLGADGTRRTTILDATLHEVPAGTTSTIHRHSWDAIMFVIEGQGATEIDGVEHAWHAWDTLHLPAWSWHRHVNRSGQDARFVTWGVQPMQEALGVAVLEDAGDAPAAELPPKPVTTPIPGTSAYARRAARLVSDDDEKPRVITRWDDVTPKVTKRGARSMFLVDEALGYRTTGITAVMHELAPGLWQSRHRHGGEAWLYVVSGHGHSTIDDEHYEWGPGDHVVVDHWCWHQHFNDDREKTARLIRVHNFGALYGILGALLDPLEMIEELPKLDAPELSGISWPDKDEGRPQ